MAKNLLRIISTLALLIHYQNINDGYSPKQERWGNINTIEKTEENLKKYSGGLINTEQTIYSLERKRDFILMRLQEKELQDSIKKIYLEKLNKTNKELREYYFQIE